MSATAFASLLSEPVRRKRVSKGALAAALQSLGQRQFSPCSVDAYQIHVVEERAKRADRIQSARFHHHCDAVRRTEMVICAAVAALFGLIFGGFFAGLAWCAAKAFSIAIPILAVGLTAGCMIGLLLAIALIGFACKWTADVSKIRSVLYLIPGISTIVGAVLEWRGRHTPFLRWEIVPIEEFDLSLIPPNVLALRDQIAQACPTARFRVHFTTVDHQQMSAKNLKDWAWEAVDPFLEVFDPHDRAFVAVWKENGFRLA